MSKKNLAIINARLLDPASNTDQIADIYIADGLIAAIGTAPKNYRADETVDASGLVVCPGLVDLCARLREPGHEHKASIRSETIAAARGGITTVCIPPDTDPVIDEPSVVDLIQKRAQIKNGAHITILGALTTRLEGTQLSELAALKSAGCSGISNALRPLANNRVLYRAMEYASTHALTLHMVSLDMDMANRGVAHAGAVATRLGLASIPVSAETVAIARTLALIEETGAAVHFGRISSAQAVAMLATAKQKKLPVTADVAIHQLLLNETAIDGFDSQAHVLPPLRSEQDRLALVEGLKTGIIDAICSDHQPHDNDAKQNPYPATEPGISGLDTLLGLSYELASREKIPLLRILSALTNVPAGILKLQDGRIAAGLPANLCIFNPAQGWTVEPQAFHSSGKNTPFAGIKLMAKATYTVIDGTLLTCSASS